MASLPSRYKDLGLRGRPYKHIHTDNGGISDGMINFWTNQPTPYRVVNAHLFPDSNSRFPTRNEYRWC